MLSAPETFTLYVRYEDYELNSKVHQFTKILNVEELEDSYKYEIEVHKNYAHNFK